MRDIWRPSAATLRFNAAISDLYFADAFFSPAVSLRSSLRARRTISSFRTDAMFGIFDSPALLVIDVTGPSHHAMAPRLTEFAPS
jgi:hypothetical protein